jgi:RHS repeat-associated protein
VTGSFKKSSATPLQYAGSYTDDTTGIVYDQARWHDPSTGQFLSQDPMVAPTLQPYASANLEPHRPARVGHRFGMPAVGAAAIDAIAPQRVRHRPHVSNSSFGNAWWRGL